MVLLVHHQQQNLEVRFGWPRWHVEPKTTIVPFVGTPKGKSVKMDTGRVVMLQHGISGLRRRAWIIGLLWNSGDGACTECLILLNSNYNDGIDWAFAVVIRNVVCGLMGSYMHRYWHCNTEGHYYNRMNLIRSNEWIYNPRMQHLFRPDMEQTFDFPELGLLAEELERLPSVMALQKINDDDANQPCKVGGTRTHVVV